MGEFVQNNEKVNSVLRENYLLMKVNTGSGNNNEDFLQHFPTIEAYPHLFVVDDGGMVIHSQGTGELEQGKGYDEEKFLAFLNEYRPN